MVSSSLDKSAKSKVIGFVCAIILIFVTLWSYIPAIDAPFVFDDDLNIVEVSAMHWSTFSWDNVVNVLNSSRLQSRPVANLSFAVNHLFGGMTPRGFHLTNIVIHLAVGAALLWLSFIYVRVAFRENYSAARLPISTAVALVPVTLFLLHPLNTQAVTYVVQRMTSLATLFVLIAFASYLIGRYRLTPRPTAWFLLAVIAWVFGLGTKENAVLLLPVILLFELCFFRVLWRKKAERALQISWNRSWTILFWLGTLTTVALASALVMARSESIGLFVSFPNRDFDGLERLLTQARVHVFYLSQLLWPTPDRLNLDHEFAASRTLFEPATTLPALLACSVLLVFSVVLAVRLPRYGFPLVAYALFHVIESGPIGLEIIFEHRMYLPSTMLVVLLAALLADKILERRVMIISFLTTVALLFALWTHQRNEVWATPLSLYGDIASKSPGKPRTQYNYANALIAHGRDLEALEIILAAIDQDQNQERLHYLHGTILMNLGRAEEAVAAYQQALSLAPGSIPNAKGLGRALRASGKTSAALRHYANVSAHLGRAGYTEESILFLENAASIPTNEAGEKLMLGKLYLMHGMSVSAREQFRTALALDPTLTEAWYNLAVIADSLGDAAEAIRGYQRFIETVSGAEQSVLERTRVRLNELLADANNP